MNDEEKKALLEEIEALMAYGKEAPTIDPALLEYLDPDALISIRESLRKKTADLKEEDREWLAQFRKEDP